MIGGMNGFLNMMGTPGRALYTRNADTKVPDFNYKKTREQAPQGPQAPQQKSLWPSLSNLSIPKVPAFASAQRGINQRIQSTRRDAASIAPEVENSLTNVQRNITKGVQRFTANIAPEVENRLPNVQSVQEQRNNLLQATAQGVKNFGAETQAGIVNTQRSVTEGATNLAAQVLSLIHI